MLEQLLHQRPIQNLHQILGFDQCTLAGLPPGNSTIRLSGSWLKWPRSSARSHRTPGGQKPAPSRSRNPKLTRVIRSAPCRRSGLNSRTSHSRSAREWAKAPSALSRASATSSRNVWRGSRPHPHHHGVAVEADHVLGSGAAVEHRCGDQEVGGVGVAVQQTRRTRPSTPCRGWRRFLGQRRCAVDRDRRQSRRPRCERQVLGTTEPLGPGSSSGSGRSVTRDRQ